MRFVKIDLKSNTLLGDAKGVGINSNIPRRCRSNRTFQGCCAELSAPTYLGTQETFPLKSICWKEVLGFIPGG